jgi:hypothetical protein
MTLMPRGNLPNSDLAAILHVFLFTPRTYLQNDDHFIHSVGHIACPGIVPGRNMFPMFVTKSKGLQKDL